MTGKEHTMAEVRTAHYSEIAALGRVHSAAWRETYRGLIDDGYLDWLTPEVSVKIFQRRQRSGLLVLAEDGVIGGFAATGRAREEDLPAETGELAGLYLLKAYQGKGYGRMLFERAEERLFAAGCRRMVLWVLAGNGRAAGFYEKMGMRFDGRQKLAVLGSPVVELRMEKDLR